MRAGKARYEDEDYLRALLLYRMVLPRNTLLEFTDLKVSQLQSKLNSDKKLVLLKPKVKKDKLKLMI